MRNPFEYGGVVSGEAFCNREKQTSDLVRAMENGEKLFVFSERRYGKTSLVRAALGKLPRKGYVCAYVDLWPTDSEATFVTTVAKAITESMSTSVGKVLETAKKFFGSLSPSVTMDEEGKPALTFGLGKHARVGPALDEVLETPARIAAKGGPRVVVVFDEFQQILEYGNDHVERKLRSVIQNHRHVSYLFLGSRKHLIQKMVLDRNRPLYRAGGHYPLGPIAEKHWQPFVRQRFADADKGIDQEHIHEVCELTQGHPFYTQHVCHVLWELGEPKAGVNTEMLRAAVRVLLDRESYAYTTLWESLALSQKRFLKGLAAEASGVKVFAGEFVSRHGLSSASNAQRAVQALLGALSGDRWLANKTQMKNFTTVPSKAGDCSSVHIEFARTKDVESVHGIKRGTLYNLLAQNKIRGCLLRVKGQKSGVRLWEMASLRELITSQLTGPRTLVGPPRLAGFPPPGPLPPLPDLPPAAALPRIAGRPPAGAPPKQGPATPNTSSALHHGD